jgi:GLPGLI family protein
MKRVQFIIVFLFWAAMSQAQQFISKGKIEFEVKTNMKKVWGDDNSPWAELMKENMPNFKTAYFNYSFAEGKSLYKFDRFDAASAKIPEFMRKDDEENSWFTDLNKGEMVMVKNVFGTPFNVKDSLRPIQWRYTNESRMIAGFNCRKAIGKIYDSVYVFVFYTEEILNSGGPCSIGGLPGMILGMTIPRLYTSWIATKLTLEGVDATKLTPPPAKKPFSGVEYRKTLIERSKEWGGEDEDSKKWVEQFLWSALL